MRYDEGSLYRPPGEWKSYLLQVSHGCTHNACTFCSMYKEKTFRIRDLSEVLEDIDMAKAYYGDLSRVFLCDGDAIVLKTENLLRILGKLYESFPSLEKVTTYAGPRSTLSKSVEELTVLRKAGLTRAYLGVESGSDAVLSAVNKGVSAEGMLRAGKNLIEAGIDLWTIVILGLTGKYGDWQEHITATVELINEMKPRHLSCLTFSPEKGTPMGDATFSGEFVQSTPDQIIAENQLLISSLTVNPLHFTSNHASNYLPLKGGLPEDREKFLALIQKARQGEVALRKSEHRRL